MLTEVFKSILLMSAAGGISGIILLCLKPVTGKQFSPKWQYYIWLTVLIAMILPVQFSLPQKTPDVQTITQSKNVIINTEMPTAKNNTAPVQTKAYSKPQMPKITLPQNTMWYLSIVWLLGAITVLSAKSVKYLMFLKVIHKNSYTDNSVLNMPKQLCVRRTDILDAPLIIGLIKPVLYLPNVELSEDNLNYILMHELIHYKRHDLLYKWFTMLVLSVHWFNPVLYIVSKQIDLDCEVSCDFAVTSKLNRSEQDCYMNMILDMLLNSRSNPRPLTTQMASNKKTLKRRFEMIRNKKKTSKFMSVLSVVIAAVILGTTVFASGVLSGIATDNYTVAIMNNGEKIKFENEPFIENGSVYVPLRETIEKTGFNQSNSNIVWDNGKIYISIFQNGNAGLYGLEINSMNMKLKHIQPSEIYDISNKFDDNTIVMSIGMKNVPILRNSNTYITLDDINYMLYSFFNVRTENNSLYELTYSVYDKNGDEVNKNLNNLKTEVIMIDENNTVVYKSENLKNPQSTITSFFETFADSDFTLMKNYCTDNCINGFFGDDYCFGMTQAELTNSETVDTDEFDYAAMVDVNMTPSEISVFDPSQISTSFYVILEKQPDGKYLIDKFATGI